MAGESNRRVAAIGTGTIGASWTAEFLARGLTVSASDPAPAAETFLREFVAAAFPGLARLSPLPAEPPWAALTFHPEPEPALAGAEFVQESAPEREELKRPLLARLDAVLDPEIVIASSSSGLLMSRLQTDCRHPERCVIGPPLQSPASGAVGRGRWRRENGFRGYRTCARLLHRDRQAAVTLRIAGMGVKNEIELRTVLVANDCDIVSLRPVRRGEPEYPVEGQGAVEIAHADADMIDPLDGDRLGHCDLLFWRDLLRKGTRADTSKVTLLTLSLAKNI
jgi:hypothetical protein